MARIAAICGRFAPRPARGARPGCRAEPADLLTNAAVGDLLRDRQWLLAGAAVAAALALGAVAIALTGGEEEAPTPVAEDPARQPAETEQELEEPGPTENEEFDVEAAEEEHGPGSIDEAELSLEERQAARTVRAYVNSLSDGDGAAVCALLAPGVIDEVDLPRDRGGCAPSLNASIGYRDPRGSPVWERARVQGLITVLHEGERASVTASVVTWFADRRQPSIEDDVVHLRRADGEWRVAKASSTLYRAVGIADVPPQVLLPPR